MTTVCRNSKHQCEDMRRMQNDIKTMNIYVFSAKNHNGKDLKTSLSLFFASHLLNTDNGILS